MDGGWRDGGEVEDEFACAGMLQGSLSSLHATVERIFRVAFCIGTQEEPSGKDGQIWLKLRGPRDAVGAAKLFVRGAVNNEEQQEVSYPEVLQCVFSGARGLFMDCLIRNTSALIVVGSPGFLLISGLAEPVVRAYSLITDLVERFQVFQSRPTEPGDRGGPGESLESRRAFKALVEKWEDRHTLDLLVLPAPLKEILLDLVRESGPESPGRSLTGGATAAGSHLDEDRTLPSTDRKADGILAADYFQASLTQERAEEAEEGAALPPSLLVQRAAAGSTREERLNGDEDPELPTRIKEFRLLLRFFTAMGYTENVVKRVLARTGLKEASEILDLVQQEQDRSEQEPPRERNRPCETEHREDNLVKRNGETPEEEEEEEEEEGELMQVEASPESKEQEEDFVLGVLKKAAASCGYAEQNVAKVYNALPNRSTHQLLLELQRETGAVREGPREMDDVMPENDRRNKEVEARGENNDLFLPAERTKPKENGLEKMPSLIAPAPRADLFTWNHDVQKLPSKTETPPQVTLSDVKGPPTPFYASSVDSQLKVFQSDKQLSRSPDRAVSTASQQSHQSYSSTSKSQSANSSMRQPPMFKDSSPTRGRDSRGFAAASSVVVTGEQRFLEGLQIPFELKLTDRPADPKLRSIVIDGSNVAMSHGLGQFFSCRGIALAVQHFWDRGHRNISALLPQWRQKSDPRIKEQHYLTALQSLGLLSFTPSREVQGKRIASYDDRLILQLAQKTDGVIVTNDNLRDLSDESPAWTNIIKKRLLQYTFVGDHFMVPDDPLGRGGPHLDDFLRSDHRTPNPGNNSFAVNFRDQAFGGGPEAGGRGRGGGVGRGHYGNATRHHGGQQWAGLRAVGGDRTPEETCGLREQLCQVFPGQENMVTLVLDCHLAEKDVNVLSDLILEQWM